LPDVGRRGIQHDVAPRGVAGVQQRLLLAQA
jgi:hypothetical protein